MHRPRDHKALVTIDGHGFVLVHDTLEDAQRAARLQVGLDQRHIYRATFRVRERTRRTRLHKWLMETPNGLRTWLITVTLVLSVVLDVVVPEYLLFWH